MLGKQQQFVNHIVRLMKEVSQFGGGRNKKVSLIEWDTRHKLWSIFYSIGMYKLNKLLELEIILDWQKIF